jgi:hypothetical protein
MVNGGHTGSAGVDVSVGVAVAGGVGELSILVGDTTPVAVGAIGVAVSLGTELQAVIAAVNRIKQSLLNGILASSFQYLLRRL